MTTLPQGEEWSYEVKFDGFRLEVVKRAGQTTLYSRRGNIPNRKFPYISAALKNLPDDTVLDGDVVALDEAGRLDFAPLQSFRSAQTKIHYYAFDILALKGKDLSQLPLADRRKALVKVLKTNEHISLSPAEEGAPTAILAFVKKHGLEGVVAKRLDSVYEPGKRSGAWCEYRMNLRQEFVVGGYAAGAYGFDAIIIGFYRGKNWYFAARVRAGLVPATRRDVFAD